MPLLNGLKVVRSKIHGYGIVALRPFTKGEVVVFGDGVMYHEKEEFDDTYALVYSDDHDPDGEVCRYLDLADQTRWINHACNPNTCVDTGLNPQSGEPYAWWTALRDIAVGEELTYDYAFCGHLAEPCNCGDLTCLGLIVDPEDLDRVPQELRHYLMPERLPLRLAAAGY
jgi:hypothetical protein